MAEILTSLTQQVKTLIAPREGLGAIAPLSEHTNPHQKVKHIFGDFWHSLYPENCVLSAFLEELALHVKLLAIPQDQDCLHNMNHNMYN